MATLCHTSFGFLFLGHLSHNSHDTTFWLSFLVLSFFSRSSSFPSFSVVLSTDVHKDNEEEEEKKHSKEDGDEKEGNKKKKGDKEAKEANPQHDAYLRVSVLETPEEKGFAVKVRLLPLCLNYECIRIMLAKGVVSVAERCVLPSVVVLLLLLALFKWQSLSSYVCVASLLLTSCALCICRSGSS